MKKLCFSLLLLCTTSVHAQSNAQASSNAQATGLGGSGYGYGGSASAIGQGGTGFGGNSSSISHGGEGGDGGNGFGGMGGSAVGGNSAGGNASNSGNAQSVHFDQQRQSPSVFMAAPAPTAPCQASMGGFLSFIGGIGLAGSRTLEECEIRELARISYAIGQPKMAVHVLCKAKYAQDFEGCRE